MSPSNTHSPDMKPVVFLDLQGTLGGDGLGDIRTFTFYPCAIPAIRLLNRHGLPAIIVTNQSRIAKGQFSYDYYEQRMDELARELERSGVHFDAAYCCPHQVSDGCVCQKPKLGLLEEAQEAFDFSLDDCYVVGDMGGSDMLMARAAGCKAILVRTGVGEGSLGEFRHQWAQMEPDFIADDVEDAARWILADVSRRGETTT